MTALVEGDERAAQAAAQIFPSAQQTGNLDEVAAPAGSLAIIASGLDVRAEHSATALAHRWHVLSEAPLARTSSLAETLIAAAESQGVLLAVAHPRRFFPALRYLHDLCHDQPLGPLLHVEIAEGMPPVRVSPRPSAGVMLESGVHALDLLIWWLGQPVRLDYTDDAFGGWEINARAEFEFSGETSAALHLTRDWRSPQRYRFEFERGLAEWTVDEARQLTLQLSGTRAAVRGELLAPLNRGAARSGPLATRAQCLHAQLEHMLAALRGSESLEISGTQSLAALKCIEACYAQRRPLLPPWFSAEEQAHLQSSTTETFIPVP